MNRMLRQWWLTLMFLGLLPAAASAQGSIAGVVKDASGGVLPGVTVEAASPALIEKTRSVTTNGVGQYKIVDLRPGTYTVTFTLTGFNTVKRDGIELTGTFVASVNVEMKVGAVEETITVTGESPIVDVQNATRNRVLEKEVIDSIPTNRSPIELAALIPGVTLTGATQDVGGTSTPIGLTNVVVHGGRAGDQRITMDGLTTQSALCSGACGNFLPNTSGAQELNVLVAAGSAEQPLGGVVINVIPREGGNTFKGSMFGAYANNSMQTGNFTQRLRDAGLKTPNSVKQNYDYNGGIGGPIVRDKLWFFVAARQTGFQNWVGGLFANANAGNPNAWTYVADPTKPVNNNIWQRSGDARITWQISPRNKIAVFYDQQSRCNCPSDRMGQGPGPTVSLEAARNPHDFPGDNLATLNYSSPISNRLLLEASAMTRREDMRFAVYPADNDPVLNLIPVTEQSNGMLYRAQSSSGYEYGHVSQMKGAVSYVTGTHAFKVGIQQQFMNLDVLTRGNNTGLAYRFNNGVPNQITENAWPYTWLQRNPWDLGLFAQDRWTTNRLTLNLGVRFDYYTTYYPEQHEGPSLLTPTRNITIPRTDFMNYKDVTPRLGASYDLFGNGKTALKVTVNRYLAALGLETTVTGTYNPAKNIAQSVTRNWTDANNNFFPDCDLTNPAPQDLRSSGGDFCGAVSNALFGQPIPSTAVDPAIIHGWGTRDFNWEFSTGVQHELTPRASVDLSYFRRIYGGSFSSAGGATIKNLAVSPSDYNPFSITAPVDSRLPNGGGYVISGLYDLNPSKVGQVNNLLTTPDNYGKKIEHWNGVDASLRWRLPQGVLLQGGLSTGRTLTDNCEVLAKVPEISPVGTPYCHVQTQFLTQLKFLGTYTVPRVGVQVAGTFQSLPGPEIAANLNVPSAQVAQTLGRPLSGNAANVTVNLVAPGTMYGERLNQFDLRFGKILKFGRTRTAVNLDLYNALNADTILTYSNTYATWLQPQSNLQARFVKVNVQFDF